MASDEVDRYVAALDEPRKTTFEAVRRSILEALPDAEECMHKLIDARLRELGLRT